MGDAPDPRCPAASVFQEGLEALGRLCARVLPALLLVETIRSFASLRPNPHEVRQEGGEWVLTEESISGFVILEADGLISLLGIKTPGLTCAAALARRGRDVLLTEQGKSLGGILYRCLHRGFGGAMTGLEYAADLASRLAETGGSGSAESPCSGNFSG